ncbi:MAG: group III truncated hemoglobin [Cyclobacteriaceae bacterium]
MSRERADIQNKDDITILVDAFYEKVKNDKLIGPIFSDVVKVDWPHHLPIMYNFWEMVLFGSGPYKGDPMTKHIQLSKKTSLAKEHFSQWLKLFGETVDDLFVGEKAEEAKVRALRIAELMQFKISQA